MPTFHVRLYNKYDKGYLTIRIKTKKLGRKIEVTDLTGWWEPTIVGRED